MDTNLLWVALAAFVGAIIGNVIKWLSSEGETTKQFLQGVLTGIIAAAVFAGAYQVTANKLTLYDLFAALVAGAGTVMAQAHIVLATAWRKAGRTFREF